jgi:hypothetical protein
MNIEELKNHLQINLKGVIYEIEAKFKHKENTQVGFTIETMHPISSHSILSFCEDFTFMAIGEARYYITFTTKLLD